MTPGVLDINARTWATPLTDAEGRVGDARLRRTTYGRGFYSMEGIGGDEYFRVRGGRLPVTCLQRRSADPRTGRARWRTWMVDDPLHWIGMRERVMGLEPGRVLVAGLGLGLFAHHVARERPDITELVVVEIDWDVVELVAPTLPLGGPPVTIVRDDYYAYLQVLAMDEGGWRPDAVLWDLAVGSPEDTRLDFIKAQVMTADALPGVPLHCFGLKGGARTIL